ncbi:MAG TPA: PEP-CTERM sorting domain-containing protein [Fimbriimonadales bacterium]|nr:PEP-CTERM sorting domain-containing protein [Fimbriimonadales bacterium]
MRKPILLFAIAALGTVANAQLVYQDPGTGNSAWGWIDLLSFYDDFTIPDPYWEIDRIETYERFGDAKQWEDEYYVDIWTAPEDLGGSRIITFKYTDISEGPMGPYGINTWAVGFQFDPSPGCDGVGLKLPQGTYWLLFRATDYSEHNYAWYNANFRNPNGSEAYVDGFGYSSQWAGDAFDMSFKIEGCAVPEPATLFAMGAGLAALAASLRRK